MDGPLHTFFDRKFTIKKDAPRRKNVFSPFVYWICILKPILMTISSCSLSNTCMTAWKCDVHRFWLILRYYIFKLDFFTFFLGSLSLSFIDVHGFWLILRYYIFKLDCFTFFLGSLSLSLIDVHGFWLILRYYILSLTFSPFSRDHYRCPSLMYIDSD